MSVAMPVRRIGSDSHWLHHAVVLAVVVAQLPFAVTYLQWLWRFDHYHFVPLVGAGVAYLFYMRHASVEWTRHSSLVVFGLLAVSLVTLLVASVVQSPWVGWLSLTVAAGAGLFASKDRVTGGSLWHLWLPVLLTLRLPLGRDLMLIAWLQSTTSAISSSVLDACGVMHHMAGNVLELPDRQLFVEEACSGVQSVFTLLFLAAFYSALERRSLIRCITLMFAAFFWAGFMNVVRVTAIALAHAKLGIDLASGWQHELLGYTALAIAFVLLVSTDRLLYFFFFPIPDDVGRGKFLNRFVLMWNAGTRFGESVEVKADSVAKGAAAQSAAEQLTSGRSRVMQLTAIVAFLSVGVFGFTKFLTAGGSQPTLAVSGNLLAEDSVQLTDNTWVVEGFEQHARKSDSTWGMHSETWRLSAKSAGISSQLDLAYPFTEWHDLTVCYRGIGWQVENTTTVDVDGWALVEFDLVNPSGEHGYVVYSQFDERGVGSRPATERFVAGIIDRVSHGSHRFQVQNVAFLPNRASDDERKLIRDKHVEARSLIRDSVLKQLGEMQ